MTYRKLKIYLSKGWTLTVCSVSVAVIALMGSCRSKKVNKSSESVQAENVMSLDEMVLRSDSLKQVLDRRSRSLIYGPPEVMQRRAAENEAMRHEIDSLDNEINKARNK